MILKIRYIIVLAALLFVLPASVSAQAKERALVETFLQAHGAGGYRISAITDKYVVRTFPGYSFFAVIFRQWPVPVMPPKGLAYSNVFIAIDGVIIPLTAVDELKAFFLGALGAVGTDADAARDAGRAWLRLSQEFSQDLFFTFSDPMVEFALEIEGSFVTGRVLVLAGGRGQIEALLSFDSQGVLVDVQDTRKVVAGIRPICQATKLLDRDPIVRRMAEQDLLVMGQAAKDYLDAQRAKASPTLRRAIDRLWQRIVDEAR